MFARLALVTGLVLLPPANAGEWSIDQLLALLAAQDASAATFIETRQSSLLLEEVSIEGRLEYRRPDFLLREIRQPFAERFEVNGTRVTVTRPDRKPDSFALRRFPLLNALVVSFRASLSGNRELLEQHYAVELQGTAEAWSLVLTPRVAAVAEEIAVIRLSGEQGVITGFELREQDGDTAVMQIKPDESP